MGNPAPFADRYGDSPHHHLGIDGRRNCVRGARTLLSASAAHILACYFHARTLECAGGSIYICRPRKILESTDSLQSIPNSTGCRHECSCSDLFWYSDLFEQQNESSLARAGSRRASAIT